MRPRLLVRLNSDPQGRVHWIRLDAEGRLEGHAESGTLGQLAAIADGRQVLGLAPASDVLLTQVRIPTQSRQRMARAVPFALEDQLAEDVDTLHFALGNRDSDGATSVAVVSVDRLEGWLAAFKDAGAELDQLYPEVLALPYEADAWTLMVEGDGFLLRTGAQSGFGGDADNLPVLLPATLEETQDQRPQRLIVYSAEAPLDLSMLEIPVENRDLSSTTGLLALSLDPKTALPLRAGTYARRRSLGAGWQRWKVAAALLAAWVVLDTGAAYFQQWQLKREVASLNQQMEQVYRGAFQTSGPVPNPRMQMENRLNAMRRQGGGDAGLLSALDKIGPVLSTAPSIQLGALTYRKGALDLELSAANLQEIDQLAQRLRQLEGLRVEVRNASAGSGEGARAEGRLNIQVSS